MSHVVSPRKLPGQERSRKTVDAILEATSRILVEEGYQAATTTRVAEIAGVSIGSLYQYFPSREALVAAIVDRHVAQILELLAQTTVVAEAQSLEETVRAFVKTVLAVHAVDPKLHAVITQNFSRVEGLEKVLALTKTARGLVRSMLASKRDEVRPQRLDLAAFVLVHAVQGVVSACELDQDGPHFADEALADELTTLVIKYLEIGAPPGGRARSPAPSAMAKPKPKQAQKRPSRAMPSGRRKS